MRKTLCVSAILLCIVGTAKAQNSNSSVIASAGGSDKTSNISLDWTLGEYAVESVFTLKNMYTQGFHQPNLIISLNAVEDDIINSAYNISIAPNPVLSILNFNINSSKSEDVIVSVTDLQGKILMQQKVGGTSSHTKLNFKNLPAGTYILSVREAALNKFLKSYQIIKL